MLSTYLLVVVLGLVVPCAELGSARLSWLPGFEQPFPVQHFLLPLAVEYASQSVPAPSSFPYGSQTVGQPVHSVVCMLLLAALRHAFM